MDPSSAVLLDAFGTLVRMDPPGPHLSAALSVTPERAEEAFRAEIAYYLEHHVEGRDEASLALLRSRCAAVLRGALGEPAPPLDTVRRAMLASIRFEPYPDAAPALRELRALGARLVVASNWDYTLPDVLQRVGLHELVDDVVTSAEAGARAAGLRAVLVRRGEAARDGESVSRLTELPRLLFGK